MKEPDYLRDIMWPTNIQSGMILYMRSAAGWICTCSRFGRCPRIVMYLLLWGKPRTVHLSWRLETADFAQLPAHKIFFLFLSLFSFFLDSKRKEKKGNKVFSDDWLVEGKGWLHTGWTWTRPFSTISPLHLAMLCIGMNWCEVEATSMGGCIRGGFFFSRCNKIFVTGSL